MMFFDFFLVRHGKTDANSMTGSVRMCGRTQAHLTEEGKEICIKARNSSPYDFSSVRNIICSDLKRTKETALIMFGDIIRNNNIVLKQDSDFNEIDFGKYEMEEKKNLPEEILKKWETSPETLVFPEGDNLLTRAENAEKKLTDICEKAENPFIIVSSCTLLRLLMTRIKKIPLANFHKISMRNGEIVHLKYSKKDKIIIS